MDDEEATEYLCTPYLPLIANVRGSYINTQHTVLQHDSKQIDGSLQRRYEFIEKNLKVSIPCSL